jgi:hypothetical protein
VAVVVAPGDTYRNAVLGFQKASPDITLELTGLRNTEWLPLSREEGDDLAVVLPDVLPLRPNGGVPPTSRTLIHYPEVDVE